MFIQTEATPNPATLKFLPGRPVMDEGTFEARDVVQAERSPLARALLELPDVTGVSRRGDLVVVTGNDNALNAVTSMLARQQIVAHQLRVDQASLEDAFIALTGKHSSSEDN